MSFAVQHDAQGAPVLVTDRLVLRVPGSDDWAGYRSMMTSARGAYLGGPRPESDAWFGFAAELGHWIYRGYGKFSVSLLDGTKIGMIGPWYPEPWPAPEIGFFLWDGFEGKGYAAEAASAALDFARQDLGWVRPISYIHPDNARSIALAIRLGATRDDTAPQRQSRVAFRHAESGLGGGLPSGLSGVFKKK